MLNKPVQSIFDSYACDDSVAMEQAIRVENFYSLIREDKINEVRNVLTKKPEVLYYVSNLRQTAFHIACQYDRSEILSILLERLPKDIDAENRFIDKRDTEGFTALMICADNNRTECAKMLLSHQPDLTVIDYDLKRNVAHLAAQKNANEILHMVLSVKTNDGKPILDVNAPCTSKKYHGFTPAHFAASNFAHKSIRTLKELDANLNIQAINHKNPLMIALQSGSQEVVSYLLEQSETDLILRDRTGHLAYHYAVLYRTPKKYVKQIKTMTERQFQAKYPKFVSKHRSDIVASENTHEKE